MSTTSEAASTTQAAPATLPAGRLAWLDGLRGIAALMVVHEHLAVGYFPRLQQGVLGRVMYGYAGVCLFFVISGYIIPASLERRGSVREFWISRVFRLFPLFVFAFLALLVLGSTGLRPVDDYLRDHATTSTTAQLTMIPRLLGVPESLGVTWTLAFEMSFYVLVAAMFVLGMRRAEAAKAWLLAVVALAAGASMPVMLLSDAIPTWPLVAVGTVLLVGSVLAMASRVRGWSVAGAATGLSLVVVLLATNLPPINRLDGLLFLALMFTGTLVHRAQHGQARWWVAIATATLVGIAFVVQHARYLAGVNLPLRENLPTMVVTVAVVGGLFAAGFALRNRALPRVLPWLGLVSYSVYLLHLLVLEPASRLLDRRGVEPSSLPWYGQGLLYLGLVGIVIAVSGLIHRLIEVPGQAFGRRVGVRLRRRESAHTPEPVRA